MDTYFDNIPSEIRSLIPGYLERRREELSEIKNLADQSEFAKVEEIAHKFKGNAASYGFEKLSQYASDLELEARAANKRAIHEMRLIIWDEIDRIERGI